MLSFGYGGKVYPVNQNEREILGLKTYPKVGDTFKPTGQTRAFMFSHEHARTVSFVRLVFERPTLRTQGA